MDSFADQVGLSPELLDLIISYSARILGVLFILFAAIVVGGWVKGLIVGRLTKIGFDATLTKFLGSLSRWAIIIFALLGCLGIFGIQTTSFAAVIGGATLAVGLAFQGSLSNVAAGAMLLLFRPYKVGDVIDVSGTRGKVDTIDLFMTTLDTPDNRRILIPNGKVFGDTIENITFHPKRRVDIGVGVGYDAGIDETRDVLMRTARSITGRLDEEEPIIYLNALGGSSVDWAVRIWAPTENYWQVREDATRAIKLALDEAGIDIPYPHRVVINQTAD